MLIDYQLSQTSVILRVKIRNSSVSTGAGLTGLTNSSSGLIISTIADVEASATVYTVAASHVQTIATLGTFAAPSASSCRFAQVDSTNHPGIYEVQLDNSRFAVSNAKSLLVSITGATNAADCDVCIPLRSINPYSTAFGLSLAKTTNITGFNDIAATSIVSAGAITTSSGAVSSVTTVGSVSGSVGSVTGAVGSVTGNVGGNVAGSVASVTGAVASVTGNVGGNVVGSVASVTATVSINLSQTGLSPRALDSVGDSSLTVGDALVCAVAVAAGKQSVSGTTYLIKTPSTATQIRSFTLDSGTSPTQRS